MRNRAYRATRYEAGAAEVRIGRRSAALDRLMGQRRCRAATFITAFNPYSRRRPDGWNRRMQARLGLAARRWPMLPGFGSWRRWHEAHWLLFGDPRPAIRLVRRFRQTAVVVVPIRQPARLVFLV